MKVHQKKLKKNNKGFSLIELIIAVTILAIIVVPLSRSFITAANTNSKAKRVMEATTLGQNFFESMKSEGVEKLVEKLFGPSYEVSSLEDKNGKKYFVYERILSESDASLDASIKSFLSANGRKYDMKVKLNPTPYVYSSGMDPITDSELKASSFYNSIPMAQLASLNEENSAFLVMDKNDDLRASIALDMEAYDAKDTDPDLYGDYMKNIKREILIKISHDNSTGETIVTGTVSYKDGRVDTNVYTAFVDHEIYRNKKPDGGERPELNNLFICFLPLYYTTEQNSTQKERIIIENDTRLPVQTYLVKQSRDTGKDFSSYKSTYQVLTEVQEGYRMDPDEKAGIRLFTNLSYTKASDRLLLTYKNGGTIVSNPNEKLQLMDEGVVEEQSDTVMYDLEIEVYKDGDAKKVDAQDRVLAKLKGTITR